MLLNTDLNPAQAEAMGTVAIIAALGEEPVVPPIPGVDGENVLPAVYAYTYPEVLTGKTVILGGGLVGVELGIFLKNMGLDVTVIEMADKLNCGENTVHEMGIYAEIKRNGLPVHTSTRALGIEDGGVACQAGGRRLRPGRAAVLPGGRLPARRHHRGGKPPGLQRRHGHRYALVSAAYIQQETPPGKAAFPAV